MRVWGWVHRGEREERIATDENQMHEDGQNLKFRMNHGLHEFHGWKNASCRGAEKDRIGERPRK
jgi:hypothetical protein